MRGSAPTAWFIALVEQPLEMTSAGYLLLITLSTPFPILRP